MRRRLIVFGILGMFLIGVGSAAFSDWGNSENVTILNSLPVVTLVSPVDWNASSDRSPTFSWSGYDADDDSLTYEISVGEYQFSGTKNCNDDISDDTLTSETYTPGYDLLCLRDNGFYYNWSVRASDDGGTTWGDWSETWHYNVTALINISLASSELNFGNMIPGDSNDTTVVGLDPFVISNDGNVIANVSVNSSALWGQAPASSVYYQFKADNFTGEEGSFNWLKSITSWTNVPLTGGVVGVSGLHYSTLNDSAEIDIRLEVPSNEAPGVKSANIIFAGSLDEG